MSEGRSDNPTRRILRVEWDHFAPVIVHSTIAKLKAHPAYAAAKAGDSLAALALAKAVVKPEKVPERVDYVVPVVQVDTGKFNAIPVAMAQALARANGARIWLETVQVNVVGHTGASGLHRLLHQPRFGGEPPPAGARVLICDDVVTYGSSLANLRGFLEQHGVKVVRATAIGAGYGSTRLAPEVPVIKNLVTLYGPELERFTARLGFEPEQLTGRESHHLSGFRSVERFRTELAQDVGPPARGARRRL
jgi:hypothetical protein